MSAKSYCSICDISYQFTGEGCPLCMLKQVSGVLCDKCGWAMKFPNDDTNTEEPCRCELVEENKKLRQMLGDTRAFLAIHVWDNERSCCFYCGEKDYGVTADDCRQAPDYELAKKIDKVLNE